MKASGKKPSQPTIPSPSKPLNQPKDNHLDHPDSPALLKNAQKRNGAELSETSLSARKSRKIEESPSALSNDTSAVVFTEPELYTDTVGHTRERLVYPFMLDGKTYYKIPHQHGLPGTRKPVSLPNPEGLQSWPEAEKRLSSLFTEGLESVSQVSSMLIPTITTGGSCHSLANYLAFGMTRQQEMYYYNSGWYEQLPFVGRREYDQDELQWGDIV
ncbi:MAG: hypothetical protein MI784_03375, partial [Cytophagales bacterium]|nr:hypothetical protein [Cytophagales bacterium]